MPESEPTHVTCSCCGCKDAVVGTKCPNCDEDVHEPCGYCGSTRGYAMEGETPAGTRLAGDWPRCVDCAGC